MAYIGAEPVPGQNREIDDISSGFNGSATAFTLQVSSTNVSPESANNILVNLGGVMQNPGTDYTIAASTLTFTTAPASGLSFWALILGAGINTATVADDTIGSSKLIDTAVTAGSYTTADITVDAQGRITAAASGTIANAEIANNAVTTAKIADSTGASDGITTAKLATDAVTAAKLASNSVVSDSIVDGSIVNADVNASAAIDVSKLSGVMPLAGGTFTDDVTFDGATAGRDVTFDRSANSLKFADSAVGVFGSDGDMQISHDGTNSTIQSSHNSNFIIKNTSNNLRLESDSQIALGDVGNNESFATFSDNGAATLFFDNSPKIATTTVGMQLTGSAFFSEGTLTLEKPGVHHHRILSNDTGNDLGFQQSSDTGSNTNFTTYLRIKNGGDIALPVDNQELCFGAGADMKIKHNGTENRIDMTNTLANLRIFGVSGMHIKLEPRDGHSSAVFKSNNAVELYYDNSKKFETTSTGGTLTGNLVNTGLCVASSGLTQVDNAQSLISQSSVGSSSTSYFIGNQQIQTSSDRRLKENIVDTEIDALLKVQKVKVVDFNWNDPSDKAINNKNARGKWIGCIAQEIVDIFPHAVNAPRPEGKEIDYNSENLWTIQYEHLVPVLIKAVQELSAKVAALEAA